MNIFLFGVGLCFALLLTLPCLLCAGCGTTRDTRARQTDMELFVAI